MASVQYLFTHAKGFSKELIKVQKNLKKVTENRVPYAIRIQKTWRGFSTKKKYRQTINAIVTIQSYFRGWKVRKQHHFFVHQHSIDMVDLKRSKAAIKIQSWWRGTLVRKYMNDRLPAKRIAERKRMQQVNDEMAAKMRELLQETEAEVERQREEDFQKKALYILYKCHHMLRTKSCKGVFSCKNDKDSVIEQYMRALPCKDYMDQLRKLYYALNKGTKPKEEVIDPPSEPVRIKGDECNIGLEEKKKFVLFSKIEEKPYVKSISYGDKKYICNDEERKDPKLLMLEHDFDLTLRKDLNPRDIPYYVDFWEKLVHTKSRTNLTC